MINCIIILKLKVGDQAPDFTLPSGSGDIVTLKDFIGKKNVVLYFYPKDDTPGCTIESCGFRDSIAEYNAIDAEVIGVSADDKESHIKFADKYELPFILLSDEEKKTIKDYDALGIAGSYIKRVTYVIDKHGKIIKIYPDVKPQNHCNEVLEVLKGIE